MNKKNYTCWKANVGGEGIALLIFMQHVLSSILGSENSYFDGECLCFFFPRRQILSNSAYNSSLYNLSTHIRIVK
jgi:hypothetical protein